MKVGSLEFDLLANVARLQQDMNRAQGVMNRSLGAIEKNVERTMRTFQRFGGVLGALLGGSIASKVIEMADGWGQYAVRMKFATESAQEYEYAQQRMVRSANETFRSINETREAFINLSPVLRDMGMNLGQSIDAVDAFSGLLVTAGANAQRGEAAMNALSSSLQKGRVDAMAWSTIYTTADGIIEHLATTTGLTTVELRKLGAEGKISAQQLADALLVAYTPVQEQMKEMPYTIRGAFRNLQNSIAEYIGRINDAASASDGAAKFIARMADNVDILMGAMIALSATVIPALIARFAALTVAMAKNPIGLIAVGIATATTYLILLRDEIGEFNKEMDSLGAVWDIVKDAASTAFNAVFDWLKDTLNLADETTSSIGGFFDAVFGGIADGLDNMHGAFIGSMAALGTLIEASTNNLKNHFLKAFDSVVDGTVTMVNKMIDGLNLVNPFSDIKHMKGVSRQAREIVNVFDAMAEASANARKENQLGAKAAYEYRKEARRINREVSELEGWYSELSEEVEKSNESTKESTVATSANTKATKAAAKAAEEFAKAREAEFNAQRGNISRIHEEAQALEDQVKVFGQGKFALEQLAIARLQEQRTMLSGFKGSEEQIELIEREIDAMERRMAAGTQLEELQEEARVRQEMTDEHIRMNEEIGRTLTDALMRGFEDGKSFAKNMRDTVINMFRTMVLRPIIEPVMQGVAGAITGALGVGGQGGGGALGLLGAASNIKSLAGAFSGSLVSSMGSGIASLGSAFGSSALGSFAAGMKGSTLAAGLAGPTTASASGAMGMGASFAAAAPWLAGGAAVLGIGSMIHKMTQGETRSGGGFVYDPNSRRAMYHSGPSGGYGGQQTLSAVESLFGSAADTIVHVFEGAGVDAGLAFFHGAFESSSKGRGGTFSGGDIVLADGSVIGFGGAKKGQGFGGTSGSTEEMFANLQAEMHFSVLEAWKTVGSQMPQVIHDMLSSIDIRSLSAEQAQAAVIDISALTGQVTTLTAALNTLPIESLKNLSFDLAYGLGQASGGMEALAANSASFYQGFYSEAERQEHLHRQLVDTLGAVNVQLPTSREGFRHLVDSLGEVTEANQATIAALLGAASAADQYYGELERRQAEAYQERQRLEQEAYNSARSHVDKLMSAFKDLAQKQIRELQQASKSTDKIANALQKSLNTQISSLTSVSSMLTDMVNELRGGAKLFEMQSVEGWRVIGNTISTGVLPDADKLRSAVGSIRSDLDDRYYGSIFERQRDQLVLANQLDSINSLAKPQLTIAEQQLQVMQDQLAELREGTKRAFELAGLSQAQIAAIKSVDDKTAASMGLTKEQLDALRTGNSASTILQNLTREQIQGILGVKSEVNGVYGLSAQQLAELSRNTGVANVIKSLTDAQIAALRSVDAKTSKALGLSESQITALQSGNAQTLALQGLTREQIQGILGVKSETSSLHGLSQSQIDAMKSVDLNTQTVAELTKRLQTAMEAESLANKQITTIQNQLNTLQAQYDQLRGLNASMYSLDQGMRLLAVAMKAEQAAKPKPIDPKAFGGKEYEFKSQAAAKNYILGNEGLLGQFSVEVASGWTTASDWKKYAQYHYSNWGWSEDRSQSVAKNQGRTHRPGTTSEAQAYLAQHADILSAYLRDSATDKTITGDKGMLKFVQSHYDKYGKGELRKYAQGGYHPGGLRLVGELGPELEVTGQSRIFNANKTQDILRNMSSGPDISGLMQGLIRENQQLRQMYETMMRSMIAMQQRMARVLERWEGDDYPVRIEEMPVEPVVVELKKEVA